MFTINDIISFVKEQTIEEDVQPDTDIEKELGCWGDDFDEFIGAYQKKFSVDMSGYLWYFHTKEEGQSIGGSFFRSPNRRVKRIPVTPQILLDSANLGKWVIKYPEHKLPKFRFDLLINMIFLLVVIFFILKSCIK